MQETGYFILLLGVLVTVHELGHFLVAKACGVKVLKFSIGFGPKLLGFTKGETEYQIALLPLGGFVKMAGDVPGEELDPEDASRGFLNQPPWKRGAIVLAGPVFNLLFPILVYFFVYIQPHDVLSTRVGSLAPDMPAAAAGIRPGDRITAVEGEKVRTFDELRDAFVGRFGRPIPLTVMRDGQERIISVTPEKSVESSVIDTVERGLIGIQPTTEPPVVGVPPGSPAEKAGLRTFDRILTVNGEKTPDEGALLQALAKAGDSVALTVVRSEPVRAGLVDGRVPRVVELNVPKQPGEGLAALGVESSELYVASVLPGSAADKAGIKPGDRLVSFNGEPLRSFTYLLYVQLSKLKEQPFQLTWRDAEGEKSKTLAQAQYEFKVEAGQSVSVLALGVRPWEVSAADAPLDKVTEQLSAAMALKKAVLVVPENVAEMVKVLVGLVTLKVPASTLGGPVMMFKLAAKTKELGWDYFLRLMAIISINLGVMNLLPIPVLDGFHLLSAAWEGVRRRPIPIRVREVANMVGLALLILLMVLVFTNDFRR